MPEFYMIHARKINKIPEFYMIFARKVPKFFLHNNCPKNIFPEFQGARAHLLLPPSLTHMEVSLFPGRTTGRWTMALPNLTWN